MKQEYWGVFPVKVKVPLKMGKVVFPVKRKDAAGSEDVKRRR
jgi:hypothetical protein